MVSVVERREAVRAVRGQLWSPGRPSKARREDRVRFWEAVAGGVSSEDAAGMAGISPSVGSVGDSYDNALAESVIGLYKTTHS